MQDLPNLLFTNVFLCYSGFVPEITCRYHKSSIWNRNYLSLLGSTYLYQTLPNIYQKKPDSNCIEMQLIFILFAIILLFAFLIMKEGENFVNVLWLLLTQIKYLMSFHLIKEK